MKLRKHKISDIKMHEFKRTHIKGYVTMILFIQRIASFI